MVLKVYGPFTAYTELVLCVLKEKEVPYEWILVDFSKNEHKSPSFLEKQPFGQTPYIDDDGFILYESRAICEYIAAKYPSQGTSLLPVDLKELALVHQAASVEFSHFNKFAMAVIIEGVYKPLHLKLERDEAAYNTAIRELSARLDVYEKILARQAFVAGDKISIADLYHLPCGIHLETADRNIMESRPHLHRWFNELSSRPSWKAVKTEGHAAELAATVKASKT